MLKHLFPLESALIWLNTAFLCLTSHILFTITFLKMPFNLWCTKRLISSEGGGGFSSKFRRPNVPTTVTQISNSMPKIYVWKVGPFQENQYHTHTCSRSQKSQKTFTKWLTKYIIIDLVMDLQLSHHQDVFIFQGEKFKFPHLVKTVFVSTAVTWTCHQQPQQKMVALSGFCVNKHQFPLFFFVEKKKSFLKVN